MWSHNEQVKSHVVSLVVNFLHSQPCAHNGTRKMMAWAWNGKNAAPNLLLYTSLPRAETQIQTYAPSLSTIYDGA